MSTKNLDSASWIFPESSLTHWAVSLNPPHKYLHDKEKIVMLFLHWLCFFFLWECFFQPFRKLMLQMIVVMCMSLLLLLGSYKFWESKSQRTAERAYGWKQDVEKWPGWSQELLLALTREAVQNDYRSKLQCRSWRQGQTHVFWCISPFNDIIFL